MTEETAPQTNRQEDQPQSSEVPSIDASPWRNRQEFGDQVEAIMLQGMETEQEGNLFHWDWVNIYGDKVSMRVENLPTDELIGPHAVLYMTQGEDTVGMELNTVGIRMYRDIRPRDAILDVGDPDQIPSFIGVCARALEAGIPPDGIMDAAVAAQPRLTDPVHDRASYFEQSRRDFSRQLSERHFL